MKQYQIKNKIKSFFRNEKKTYEFFAYFVQNLVLIVLNFILLILFLTNFNTLVLLFLVCAMLSSMPVSLLVSVRFHQGPSIAY
jgi:hypothetical protein